MNTEKPALMSDSQLELWGRCVASVLGEVRAEREARAYREREQTAALVARARCIRQEARRVPPEALVRSSLGAALVDGLAWLAACVEAGVHVGIDPAARSEFEAALLAHGRARPEVAEIDWWSALVGHDEDLDDPTGRCSCGVVSGGYITLAEIHRRAREKYDAVARSGGGRWAGAR